ncbi:MAG: hypothetical protein HY555_05220 [Euryarchaeota archaeon]|nr:hypothetical protein [Euryarchaeota archaeon]
MGTMRELGIGVLFAIVLFIGAVLVSAVGDTRALGRENLLILVVDETQRDQVLLGYAMEAGEEGFPVRSSERIGGLPLRSIFFDSREEGAKTAVGRNITRFFDPKVENRGKELRIDRLVVIETSVLDDVIDALGGLEISKEVAPSTVAYTSLSGADLIKILRGKGFSDAGKWTVTITDPSTGSTSSIFLEGEGLEREIKRHDPSYQWYTVKAMILATALETIKDRFQKSQRLKESIARILAKSYQSREISIYAGNTVTELAKWVPPSILEGRALEVLAGL